MCLQGLLVCYGASHPPANVPTWLRSQSLLLVPAARLGHRCFAAQHRALALAPGSWASPIALPTGMPWDAGWGSLALYLLLVPALRFPSPSRLQHLLRIGTSDGSEILHAFLLYACLGQAKHAHAVGSRTDGKGAFPGVWPSFLRGSPQPLGCVRGKLCSSSLRRGFPPLSQPDKAAGMRGAVSMREQPVLPRDPPVCACGPGCDPAPGRKLKTCNHTFPPLLQNLRGFWGVLFWFFLNFGVGSSFG